MTDKVALEMESRNIKQAQRLMVNLFTRSGDDHLNWLFPYDRTGITTYRWRYSS